MNKTCIIVFYFGDFPWYHDFFVQSCIKNESFDFLFLSDAYKSFRKEKNIIEQPFSITEFNKLATEKLGFEISVNNGLKICDFRPAFGIIFSEYLVNYDFWGYSDTDIILGKLDKFITNELLSNHDFISVREKYPSGFFALYRNTESVNNLFRASESYKDQFLVERNTLFEECGGYYHDLIGEGINILDTKCPNDTIHHLLERHKDEIRSFYKEWSIDYTSSLISKINDNLFHENNELLMYHLSNFKKNYFLKKPKTSISDQNFFIFQYSIKKKSPLNYLLGRWYDYKRNLFIGLSNFIDSKLKLSAKTFDIVGSFEYMTAIIDFINIDGNPVINYYGDKIPIYNSLLSNNLFYIHNINARLEITQENLLTVIFHNGNKLVLIRV